MDSDCVDSCPGPAADHPYAFEKLLIVSVSLSPHL